MTPVQPENLAGIPYGWVVTLLAFFVTIYGMTIIGRAGFKIGWDRDKGFSINASAAAPPSNKDPK